MGGIVPSAGPRFSGPSAAQAFKLRGQCAAPRQGDGEAQQHGAHFVARHLHALAQGAGAGGASTAAKRIRGGPVSTIGSTTPPARSSGGGAAGLAAATPWALAGFAVAPLALRAARPVYRGATGAALIPVLAGTGATMLGWAIIVAVALWAPWG